MTLTIQPDCCSLLTPRLHTAPSHHEDERREDGERDDYPYNLHPLTLPGMGRRRQYRRWCRSL